MIYYSLDYQKTHQYLDLDEMYSSKDYHLETIINIKMSVMSNILEEYDNEVIEKVERYSHKPWYSTHKFVRLF